jgi:hypothetical protein
MEAWKFLHGFILNYMQKRIKVKPAQQKFLTLWFKMTKKESHFMGMAEAVHFRKSLQKTSIFGHL